MLAKLAKFQKSGTASNAPRPPPPQQQQAKAPTQNKKMPAIPKPTGSSQASGALNVAELKRRIDESRSKLSVRSTFKQQCGKRL